MSGSAEGQRDQCVPCPSCVMRFARQRLERSVTACAAGPLSASRSSCSSPLTCSPRVEAQARAGILLARHQSLRRNGRHHAGQGSTALCVGVGLRNSAARGTRRRSRPAGSGRPDPARNLRLNHAPITAARQWSGASRCSTSATLAPRPASEAIPEGVGVASRRTGDEGVAGQACPATPSSHAVSVGGRCAGAGG